MIRLKSDGHAANVAVPNADTDSSVLRSLSAHILDTVGRFPTLAEVLESVPRLTRRSNPNYPSRFVVLKRDSPWIPALEEAVDYREDQFERDLDAYVSDADIVDATMAELLDEMRTGRLLPTPAHPFRFPHDGADAAERMRASIAEKYPRDTTKMYFDDVDEEYVVEHFCD